jgi:hypothetical protein
LQRRFLRLRFAISLSRCSSPLRRPTRRTSHRGKPRTHRGEPRIAANHASRRTTHRGNARIAADLARIAADLARIAANHASRQTPQLQWDHAKVGAVLRAWRRGLFATALLISNALR